MSRLIDFNILWVGKSFFEDEFSTWKYNRAVQGSVWLIMRVWGAIEGRQGKQNQDKSSE